MNVYVHPGICESLAKQWNRAKKEGNVELMKKIEKELWFLRLYCERSYDNFY